MKAWNKKCIFCLLFLICVMLLTNVFMVKAGNDHVQDTALVDVNRLYHRAMNGEALEDLHTKEINVEKTAQDTIDMHTYMNHGNEGIILLPAKEEGWFYKFTYSLRGIPDSFFWIINLIFVLVLAFVGYIMLHIQKQIILPFHKMEHMAEALKNRDFTYELPEQKSMYFGRFVWAVDVMKDELRHHEEREIRLMKDKKTMIASLSHDIKTPLSNIRLYADAMMHQLYPLETVRQRICENCDRIDGYVKDIMKTSNQDLFDFSVHMEEVYLQDIKEILEREGERVQLAMVEYNVRGCFEGLVYTDPLRLHEVIHNVVDNALKYGDGKWIHVNVYEEDGHAILQIENSGKGVDVRDTNALYQSFWRGNDIGNKKGNGLGLYICKQLMKHMQGDIFMTQKEGSISFHVVLDTL